MMRRVFVLISLVVAILGIVGNVFAQDETPNIVGEIVQEETPNISEPSLDPEWKLVFFIDSSDVTAYVNTRRINYLPEGIVEVWILIVPRGELREMYVNSLKENLTFKGKDPNNAERLWYTKAFEKINCRTHQIAHLEMSLYSFEETVLDSHSFQYEKWNRIVPRSIGESVEKFVCKKHKKKK